MHIPALHPVRVKRGPARRALIALGLIAILATITVIQRIIHVTKQAATSDGK